MLPEYIISNFFRGSMLSWCFYLSYYVLGVYYHAIYTEVISAMFSTIFFHGQIYRVFVPKLSSLGTYIIILFTQMTVLTPDRSVSNQHNRTTRFPLFHSIIARVNLV